MNVLNALLRPLFDAVLYPFRGMPSIVGLTVISIVVSIGMLLVFKKTSNQERLAAVKRKIHAGLFEIRLFNDDVRAIFRAQGHILRHNLSYLRYSAAPLLWLLPPFVLIVAQLQFHYGYRGLEPGEPVLLEVELTESAVAGGGKPQVTLELPDGLRLDSPSVWIPTESEMSWRLVAERPGDYEIGVRVADASVVKRVVSDDRVLRRSPNRHTGGFWDALIWPAEPPLPDDGPVAEIRLAYPDADVWFLGLRLHWLVVFFILTIVFAFALRNRFGVTI